MAIFFGEFPQTIDAKNRLSICAGLRQQINPEVDGKGIILLIGGNLRLRLYPDLYYERLVEAMPASALPDRDTQPIGLMFGMARRLRPDSQGRIVLPELAMRRAVICESVMLVGSRDHIQIWPAEAWERHVEASLPTYGEALYEAAERLRAAGRVPAQLQRDQTDGRGGWRTDPPTVSEKAAR